MADRAGRRSGRSRRAPRRPPSSACPADRRGTSESRDQSRPRSRRLPSGRSAPQARGRLRLRMQSERDHLRDCGQSAPNEKVPERDLLAEESVDEERRDERRSKNRIVVRVDGVARVELVGQVVLKRRGGARREVPQEVDEDGRVDRLVPEEALEVVDETAVASLRRLVRMRVDAPGFQKPSRPMTSANPASSKNVGFGSRWLAAQPEAKAAATAGSERPSAIRSQGVPTSASRVR